MLFYTLTKIALVTYSALYTFLLMVSLEEQQRIEQSMQQDSWQFIQEDSGFSWLRTASNREVVGLSHRSFATREQAVANARMVGYENEFAPTAQLHWEEYQDANGEYRWRLLDSAGTVINRSHEGYKTKAASQKNAVRHGYGHMQVVPTGCVCPQDCTNVQSAVLPYWIVGLGVLAFILLPFFRTEPIEPPLPPTVGRIQLFADVPPGLAQAACINSLGLRGVFEGSGTKSGQDKPVFGLQNYVPLYELAKVMAEMTSMPVETCSTVLADAPWYEPYKQCAQQNNWRAFTGTNVAITDNATKADVATTVLDAYGLTVEQAERKGVLIALGDFEPTELVTRSELASLLCSLRDLL